MFENLTDRLPRNSENITPKEIVLLTWMNSVFKATFNKSKTNSWSNTTQMANVFAIEAELTTDRSKKKDIGGISP